jgi:UDP:flavonoid glycosyltransferase YjiC (YdhE family)
MNFLALSLGSIGDFFPFLAIAEGLRKRGHRIVMASNAGYGALARMAGFEFAALWERTDQSIDALIAQDPAKAWSVVHQEMFVPATAPARNCIAQYLAHDRWTLLASWSVFAAIDAHDAAGVPLCKVYLSPGAMDGDRNRRPDGPGLRNIGLFPGWFHTTPGITQTGFPMLDDTMVPALSAEIENFLRAGPKPVIFLPGSFMRGADTFFRESLAACRQLGLRAIFLTPHREQIPQNLPGNACYAQYAPLDRLAPRCAAMVHHGGIGTLAQGLKAGIPQLVTPRFFDQPDNAAHLDALGVSRTLQPQSYSQAVVAEQLKELMGSRTILENCARAAAHFGQDGTIGRTCDIAEALA